FFFPLAARRAARYCLIFALGTSLCWAQTIPNTGAAGLVQPGTGHSCLGRRRTGASSAAEKSGFLGGRPRRRGNTPPEPLPSALTIAVCTLCVVAASTVVMTCRTNWSINTCNPCNDWPSDPVLLLLGIGVVESCPPLDGGVKAFRLLRIGHLQ